MANQRLKPYICYLRFHNVCTISYDAAITQCTVSVLKLGVSKRTSGIGIDDSIKTPSVLDSSWNMMAHGDAQETKWRGNWLMEWVASTLHTTSEHGVSSIITADAHTSVASSRLNWSPRRFKWTRPFRRKTKSGFCACAITFQLASTPLSKRWNKLSASGNTRQKETAITETSSSVRSQYGHLRAKLVKDLHSS
jgi:hypothetical protein